MVRRGSPFLPSRLSLMSADRMRAVRLPPCVLLPAADPILLLTAELNIPYYPFLRRNVDCIIALDASADSQVRGYAAHRDLHVLTDRSPQDLWFTRAEGIWFQLRPAPAGQLTLRRARGQARSENVAARRYLADPCPSWRRGCRGSLGCPGV